MKVVFFVFAIALALLGRYGIQGSGESTREDESAEAAIAGEFVAQIRGVEIGGDSKSRDALDTIYARRLPASIDSLNVVRSYLSNPLIPA